MHTTPTTDRLCDRLAFKDQQITASDAKTVAAVRCGGLLSGLNESVRLKLRCCKYVCLCVRAAVLLS